MKNVFPYVCLCLVLIGCHAFIPGESNPDATIIFKQGPLQWFVANGAPSSSNPTQLRQGIPPELAQRLDIPSNDLHPSDEPISHFHIAFFPLDPLFNNFTHQGVFHRYRPRDPTKA